MKQIRNNKKPGRKWLAACLAVLMLASVFLPTVTARAAASTVTVDKAIRIGVGAINAGIIHVQVPTKNRVLKNFSVTENGKATKNLKHRVTRTYNSPSKTSDADDYYREITVYATKAGTYKLSFDICIGDRKTNSRTVTVYALKSENSMISTVTFAGSKANVPGTLGGISSYAVYFPSKTTGTVKFSPAPGMKISSIIMTCLNEKGKTVTKTISNGATITLSNVAAKYSYDTSTDKVVSKPMWAGTSFTIKLKDTYNGGRIVTVPIALMRIATKWVAQ